MLVLPQHRVKRGIYMFVMQVAAEGETYYRYGVMLKKVANFYNNMASQASKNKAKQSEAREIVTNQPGLCLNSKRCRLKKHLRELRQESPREKKPHYIVGTPRIRGLAV